MIVGMLILQVVLMVLVAMLLMRRSAAPAAVDARLQTLPDDVLKLSTKVDAMDAALRNNMGELRRDQGDHATQARHATTEAGRALREEIAASIALFRTDSNTGAEQLRAAVQRDFVTVNDKLTAFFTQATRNERDAQAALHASLTALGEAQRVHQDALRASMEERLGKLNADNAAKLEEMRATVDEKLHATLQTRLTESFGAVSDQLTKVHTGLGEMKELATGVSDLKKVFSNVKSRGIVGEFQLGMQLEQMFSREQYERNAQIKPGSAERVEYAIKVPQGNETALFAIDSKFPREDWERLEDAYEHGSAEQIAQAGAAFERAIRTQAKSICEKYIHEPITLPHAIMFLPTEGLYAEVMRRPGLQTDLQQNSNVTIAGPSTLMAILTSFRMGFHTIAFEKKSSEIRDVLTSVKTEFGKFGTLMAKVEKQVGTVQTTLGEIAGKTKTINRNLRYITELPAGDGPPATALIAFEEFANVAPLLAASSEED